MNRCGWLFGLCILNMNNLNMLSYCLNTEYEYAVMYSMSECILNIPGLFTIHFTCGYWIPETIRYTTQYSSNTLVFICQHAQDGLLYLLCYLIQNSISSLAEYSPYRRPDIFRAKLYDHLDFPLNLTWDSLGPFSHHTLQKWCWNFKKHMQRNIGKHKNRTKIRLMLAFSRSHCRYQKQILYRFLT